MNRSRFPAIRSELQDRFEGMVQTRRHLHQRPELGFQERQTAEFVAERLRGGGLEVRTGLAGTGVVGLLRSGQPRAILLRSDMDALPVQEETGTPHASRHPGVMHACGHDGHMTILTETASLWAAGGGKRGGDLVFVFQPAEEGPGGAQPMIEAGVLENPKCEAAFGLHLWSPLPLGKIAVTSGPTMAAVDEFEMEIIGRGGHGAFPHTAIDPVVAGSYIVTALQTLVARNVDPFQTAVVTVGSFQAGSAPNIIPERAHLRGTVRSFDPALRTTLVRRLQEVAEGTARSLGASCEIAFRTQYPAVVNDPALAEFVAAIAAEVVGPENVIRDLVMMGGEDMAYFLEKLPGCFFFIGAGNESKGIIHPHHSPRFDFDEEAMPIGCEMFLRIGERYFERFPGPGPTSGRRETA